MDKTRFAEILKAVPVFAGEATDDEKKKWAKTHSKPFSDAATEYLWATKANPLPEEERLLAMVANTDDDQKQQIDTIAQRWKASIHDFIPVEGTDWSNKGTMICKACSAPESDIRHRKD